MQDFNLKLWKWIEYREHDCRLRYAVKLQHPHRTQGYSPLFLYLTVTGTIAGRMKATQASSSFPPEQASTQTKYRVRTVPRQAGVPPDTSLSTDKQLPPGNARMNYRRLATQLQS